MFSCGRPCLRRRGLSALLDTVAAGPDEPLLFLYPRWATTAVRQRRPITSLNPITAPTRDRQAPGSLCRPTIRSCPVPSLCRQNSQPVSPSTGDNSQDVSDLGGPPIAGGIDLRHRRRRVAARTPTKDSSTRQNSSFNIFADMEEDVENRAVRPPTSSGRRKALKVSRFKSVIERSGEDKSTMWKLSPEDRRKLRNARFLRMQNFQRNQRDITWNRVKMLLQWIQQNSRPWSRKGDRHLEMQIPEETVALLSGMTDTAMKENIWYWAVHHGCRVHILSPKIGNGTHRKVILSGSEHVLELVSERIDRVQSLQASRDPRVDIVTPGIPLVASTEALRRKNLPVPVPRAVWDIMRAAKKPKPLDKVLAARPSLSTVREFTEYIEDLTHATEANQKANRDPSIPYQEQIAQEIVVLFREDSIRKCLSTAALNRALIFLCDHQRLRRARVVFSIAEHVATADTYNILLRSAAQHQHLHVFKWLLLSMWRVHIRPNPDTWLALLEALVNPHEKAALMTQMAQLGYLKDTSTIRRALQLTVQNSLLVHLESGQSIDVFINSMVTTHGTNWFSPSLLRDMFSVIARLRDFDSAERLLQICTQHNLLVDSSSLAEIVYMCRRDIFSALYFTKLFLARPSFRLSTRTWERLFLVAFKGRHYNICRVMWRYACMNKAVSHNMKRAVLSSLSRNVSMKNKDLLTNCFLRRAGKVIIGVPGNNKRATFKESTLNDLPSEFHANPISYFRRGFLAGWEERSRQLRLAKALVARDIDLGASLYRPKQPLNLMLDAAATMDREWRDKLHGLRGLTFLLDHVIEVPVWRYGLTKSKRGDKTRREGAQVEYPVLVT